MKLRSELTNDVRTIVDSYGTRLRGSWADAEQHLVLTGQVWRSFSDIDIISKEPLSSERIRAIRQALREYTEGHFECEPAISIRVESDCQPDVLVSGTPRARGEHNTMFWAYIALLELKHALAKVEPADVADAEPYYQGKFVLNIWRNVLLDKGLIVRSYSEILRNLFYVPDEVKTSVLSLKTGGPPLHTALRTVEMFKGWTVKWTASHCRQELRAELLMLLAESALPSSSDRVVVPILDRLDRVAVSQKELNLIAYSRAKSGVRASM